MRRLLFLLGAAIAVWDTAARADDKAQCFDGASQGQTLRDQHKLVEARAQFTLCARQECPKPVSKDCTSWLEQVDQALPSVVVSASDAGGHDLLDVTVTLDGHPFATRLNGEAVAINPGAHSFHFEMADGTRLDHQVLVREGVKNQSVAVVLGHAAAPVPAPLPATPLPTGPAAGGTGGQPGESPAGASSTWKTVGFIAGGVGIAGLGVGTVFGFVAMGDKNNAHCDASGGCKSGPLADARSAATLATVGFIAGGVLLAGGAALVLWAPRGRTTEARSLRLVPTVGARDGGFLLAGSW